MRPWLKALIQGCQEAAGERTVRFTGAGYDIFVHLYIDGDYTRTDGLITK